MSFSRLKRPKQMINWVLLSCIVFLRNFEFVCPSREFSFLSTSLFLSLRFFARDCRVSGEKCNKFCKENPKAFKYSFSFHWIVVHNSSFEAKCESLEETRTFYEGMESVVGKRRSFTREFKSIVSERSFSAEALRENRNILPRKNRKFVREITHMHSVSKQKCTSFMSGHKVSCTIAQLLWKNAEVLWVNAYFFGWI